MEYNASSHNIVKYCISFIALYCLNTLPFLRVFRATIRLTLARSLGVSLTTFQTIFSTVPHFPLLSTDTRHNQLITPQ